MEGASSSSSRREDFRRGFEEEVKLDLDLRLESVDSLSSSSRRFDLLDTSEPTRDRPELDRPKLNMMTGEMGNSVEYPRLSSFVHVALVQVVRFRGKKVVTGVWGCCRVANLVADRWTGYICDGVTVFEVVVYIRERWTMELSNGQSEVERLLHVEHRRELRITVHGLTPATLVALADRREASKVSGWFRHNGTHRPLLLQLRLGTSTSSVESYCRASALHKRHMEYRMSIPPTSPRQ